MQMVRPRSKTYATLRAPCYAHSRLTLGSISIRIALGT